MYFKSWSPVGPINESAVCCINKSSVDSQKYATKMKSNRALGEYWSYESEKPSSLSPHNSLKVCTIILTKYKISTKALPNLQTLLVK